MKKLTLVAMLCMMVVSGRTAHGQQGDVAFGVDTLTAPSASSASGNYSPQSLTGGAYPVFSGDVIFFKHQFGISGDVAWKASRGLYQGSFPYRPILYDFNGIWIPSNLKHVTPELMAGIGAESVRFYQNFFICGFSGCTNYSSSNHFLGHFGGGLRLYVKGNFFIRPEAHLYLVHNNFEFSSGRATRFGVSIGYTLRPPQ